MVIPQRQYQFPRDDQNQVGGMYLTHFQRKLLKKVLDQQDLPDKKLQRIQIMLLADEGKTQAEICEKLGCCQATARHWISMARNGLVERWNSNCGRPAKITPEFKEYLKQLVTKKPKETYVPNQKFTYSIECWNARILSEHLHGVFGIKVTPQYINKLLKQMGLSTRSKPIQILDLDNVSVIDASEIWNLNHLTIN